MRTLAVGLILILAVPGMAAAGDTPNLSPPVDRPLSVNKKSSAESSSTTLDAQNLIVNGDFENNVGGCLSNLSNAQFDASISNATAFGPADEIDMYNDPGGCGYGLPPQSGTTKLAIHRQRTEVGGATDAFSLDLSPSVVAGSNYHLSLYANVVMQFDTNVGPVEVGLSSSPTDFGTLIFSGTPSTSEWTLLDGDFTAPVDAAYLTVRVGTDGTWIHIDNFRLESTEAMDSDGDGVPDTIDQCPGTPAGEAVDAVGCSCSQKTCPAVQCQVVVCDTSTAQCMMTGQLPNGTLCDPDSCGSLATCVGGCVGGVCTAGCNFSSASSEPERCFDGIGPRCDGVPGISVLSKDQTSCLVTGPVSIGSILHDRCCFQSLNFGWSCLVPYTGNPWQCVTEWNEAVANTFCTSIGAPRQWSHTWGPYPVGNTGDNISVVDKAARAPSGTRVNPKYQYLCASGGCPTDKKGKTIKYNDICGVYCICK